MIRRHIFGTSFLACFLLQNSMYIQYIQLFAIADEKICTESAPPHSISVSLITVDNTEKVSACGYTCVIYTMLIA